MMEKVDPKDIQIKFSQNAIDQLSVITENDHTIGGLVFRLKIDGKGCNGFDYILGFSEPDTDDMCFCTNHGE